MPAEANRKIIVRTKVGSLELSSLEGKILGNPWVLLSTEQQSQAGIVFLDEFDLLRPQIPEGSELEVEVIITGASPTQEYKRNIFKGVIDHVSRVLPNGCEVLAIDMSQKLAGDVSPQVHSPNPAQNETSIPQGIDQVLGLIDNPQTQKILGKDVASRLKSGVKEALKQSIARPVGTLFGEAGYTQLKSAANTVMASAAALGQGKLESGFITMAQGAGAALGDAAKKQINQDAQSLLKGVTGAVKNVAEDVPPAIRKQIDGGISSVIGTLKGIGATPGAKMLSGQVERTLGSIAGAAGTVLGQNLQKNLNAEFKRTIDTILGPAGNLLEDSVRAKIQSAALQGLKATMGTLKGIGDASVSGNDILPQGQGVAAAALAKNLKFERNSSAAPPKSGEIDLSRSKLRAGSDRALLEGDQLIARGNTIRQVAPGQGGATGVVLDYQTMRHAFKGSPRFTHHSEVKKGSLEVRGWSMAEKAVVSYKVEREEPGPETVLIGVHNPTTVAEAKHYATKLDAKQRSRQYEYNGSIDLATLPEVLELDAQKNFTIKNVSGEFDGDSWMCDEVLFEPLRANATIKAFKG